MSIPAHEPNFRSLDCLRGLLAAYVLCGHARWLLWTGNSGWDRSEQASWANLLADASALLRYGHEAVMVFFVLSGFFIHLRMANTLSGHGASNWSINDYGMRRVRRILPGYIVALLVTVLLDSIGRAWFPVLYEARTGDSLLDKNFLRKGYQARSVIPALCLMPSSLGYDFGTNGPLWSLAFEIGYYAWYPIWLAIRRRSIALAYVFLPMSLLAVFSRIDLGFFSQMMVHFVIWLVGAGLAELVCAKRLNLRPYLAVPLLAAGCGLVVVWRSIPTDTVKTIGAGLFGMMMVWGFACFPSTVVRRSWHRLCEYLGYRSYTIYVTHFPILVLCSSYFFTTYGGRSPSGLPAVLCSTATLLVSIGLFEVGERRFLGRHLPESVAPAGEAHMMRPAKGAQSVAT